MFGSESEEEPSSSAGTPTICLEEERVEPVAPSTPLDHEEEKMELTKEVETEQVVLQPAVEKILSPVKRPHKKKMAVFGQRTEEREAELMASFLKTSPDKEDLSMLKEAMDRLKGMSDIAAEGTPWAHYPHNILLSQWEGGKGGQREFTYIP